METKKLLTIMETSSVLGIGRTLTYRLINEGAIRAIKVGNSRRVPLGEVDAYIQRQLQQCEGQVNKTAL